MRMDSGMVRVACSVLVAWLTCGSIFGVPAAAQERDCRRAAVVTLPGVVWADVQTHRPPNLLAVTEAGSMGSIAMRTNSARILYGSGFVSISAGTRADAPRLSGAIAADRPGTEVDEPGAEAAPVLRRDVGVGGFPEIIALAEEADYRGSPGALGTLLRDSHPPIVIGNGDPGIDPPTPLGRGLWVLLAGTDERGTVALSATGDDLLVRDPVSPFGVRTDPDALTRAVDAALDQGCSTLFVDQGDLLRVDRQGRDLFGRSERAFGRALHATDQVIGQLAAALDPGRDLLLVVSPHSPRADRGQAHLGVAVARGPGFPSGTWLSSASTRQRGIVTLPDVAPTILAHLGIERPPGMIGRSWIALRAPGPADERIEDAVRLNDESVFTDRTKAGISTGFVIVQILVYLAAIFLMWRREKSGRSGVGPFGRSVQFGGLAIVAFPLASYLANPLDGQRLGVPLFIGAMIAIDAVLVAVASLIAREPLGRLLFISASTVAVIVIDLFLDAGLQLNATFGNEPIVAGRFAGLGNLAFSILGTCSVMTGALIIHRWPGRRPVFIGVALLFAITVYVDGAPGLGADVGGVIALVPSLGITLLLLSGRRPNPKILLAAAAGTVAALALFLLLDMSRSPEERTHLARLFEDIKDRGTGAFIETVQRKIRTNLRVFRSTIWTYLVPPALAVMAWLLLRPTGRWHRLAVGYPKLRAGLIGGLILAVVGYAVNDSGIVIPAMVLSYLAPMSMLIHLKLEDERTAQEQRDD